MGKEVRAGARSSLRVITFPELVRETPLGLAAAIELSSASRSLSKPPRCFSFHVESLLISSILPVCRSMNSSNKISHLSSTNVLVSIENKPSVQEPVDLLLPVDHLVITVGEAGSVVVVVVMVREVVAVAGEEDGQKRRF